MNIRFAKEADHGDIWSMLEPVFRAGDTYAVDQEISRADALAYWTSENAYVVEAEDDLVGTFYIRKNQSGGGRFVCNCGYVTKRGAQGRGVARAMLEFSLSEAKELGFSAMQFNFVLSTNTRAIAIWEQAGFLEIGRQPKAFRHPDGSVCDALILHRFL